MKTRSWMLFLAAILGIAALGLGPTSAAAVAPAATGWWTEAEQGAYTGGVGGPFNPSPNPTHLPIRNPRRPAQAPPPSAVPTRATVRPPPPPNPPPPLS